MSQLLLFAYFLESGLLLLVVPWSTFWERNFFVESVPALAAVLTNPYVRGAISGLGAVCLGAAFAELGGVLTRGRARDARGFDSLTDGH